MPLSVGLLSIGALWAMLLGGSALGMLGLGTAITALTVYGVLKLNDESFVRSAIRDSIAQEQRYKLKQREFKIEELDVESRVRMKAIAKLQSEIAEDIDNSPIDALTSGFSDTLTQTQNLVERGLAIASKRRELQRYLNKTEATTIEARIKNLIIQLNEEKDPIKRSEIKVSIAAKKQELIDYKAIKQASERVISELDTIECSFSSLRARLVRIKSTDAGEWLAANKELQNELLGLNTTVNILEQSIQEALPE